MGLLSGLGRMAPMSMRSKRAVSPFDPLPFDQSDGSYDINSISQQIEDDAMPTMTGEIDKLGMAATGVPNEPYSAGFDDKMAAAGLDMMSEATPDQPDYMQVRRGPRWQRQTPYSYKPYGQ